MSLCKIGYWFANSFNKEHLFFYFNFHILICNLYRLYNIINILNSTIMFSIPMVHFVCTFCVQLYIGEFFRILAVWQHAKKQPKLIYTCTHNTHARTHVHAHARAHTRTHTHTHSERVAQTIEKLKQFCLKN